MIQMMRRARRRSARPSTAQVPPGPAMAPSVQPARAVLDHPFRGQPVPACGPGRRCRGRDRTVRRERVRPGSIRRDSIRRGWIRPGSILNGPIPAPRARGATPGVVIRRARVAHREARPVVRDVPRRRARPAALVRVGGPAPRPERRRAPRKQRLREVGGARPYEVSTPDRAGANTDRLSNGPASGLGRIMTVFPAVCADIRRVRVPGAGPVVLTF